MHTYIHRSYRLYRFPFLTSAPRVETEWGGKAQHKGGPPDGKGYGVGGHNNRKHTPWGSRPWKSTTGNTTRRPKPQNKKMRFEHEAQNEIVHFSAGKRDIIRCTYLLIVLDVPSSLLS